MSSTTLSTLAGVPGHLRVLELEISQESDVSDAAVDALLQRSRALRKLTATYRTISDTAFVHVAQCATLQTVSLAGTRGLTAHTLQTLSLAPALTNLDVTGCGWLSDAALAHLERCQTLTELKISVCNQANVSDTALASLGRLPALLSLRMRYCTQHTITDAGFAALAQSRSLQELDMSECYQPRITDTALEHLSRCASLTRLNVTHCTQTAWSAAAVRALASSRSLLSLGAEHTRLNDYATWLGESASLRTLFLSLRDGQSFVEWARTNAALLHAPRLRSVAVDDSADDTPERNADADAAMAVLQAAWEARPAAVKDLRAAAAAAGADPGERASVVPLTIELGFTGRSCVLH
jgi:hypothetical protein